MNTNISDFLENTVYPALWQVLPNVFPEFGFVLKNGHWQATNKNYTKTLPGAVRADRVIAYRNTPFGYKIHGGEFVAWLQHVNNMTTPKGEEFIKVARQLCEMVGESLPEEKITAKAIQIAQERERRQNLWEAFWSYAQRELLASRGEKALEYAKNRGITEEKIRQYLGFFSSVDEVKAHLLYLGFTEDEIGWTYQEVLTGKPIGSGLLYDKRWEERLIGAWRNRAGRIINFWARKVSDTGKDQDKYLMLKGGSKDSPYGLDMIHVAEASLVEGFLDALPLWPAFPAIASGGAALTQKQIQAIAHAGVQALTLNMDYDGPNGAGHKGTIQAVKSVLSAKPSFRLYVVDPLLMADAQHPEAKVDPHSFVRKHGEEVYKTLAEEKAVCYLARTALQSHRLSTAKGKDSAIAELVEYAKQIDSEVDREAFWQKVAEQTGWSLNTLMKNAEQRTPTGKEEETAIVSKPDALDCFDIEGQKDIIVPAGGWIVPEDWHLERSGIYMVKVNQKGEEQIQKIAHTPVILSARSVNIDSSNEQLEVAFPRDKVLRKIWVDRGELMNHRSVITLASQGFPVNSRKAGMLVDYLTDFEASNIHHMPRLLTVNSFGWKRYDGDLFFVLGDKAIGTGMKINFVPEGEGERHFARGLAPKGSYQEWLKIIRKAIVYPKVAFGIYSSFAAPLLPILEVSSFSNDYCGDSSTGKTTAIMVAASLWGDPVGERGGIVPTWNATTVSVERYASLFKALPIFLDDSHLAPDQQVKSVIYMIAGGTGKLRGALKGSQKLCGWHTVGFFTGEKPVIAATTLEGARARVNEFSGTPFPGASAEAVSEIKIGVSNHFGHGGPMYLEKIIKLVRENKEELRKQTRQRQSILGKIAHSGIDNRRTAYFAVAWTAGVIAEEVFGFGSNPDTLIPTVFEEICDEGVDFAHRAMDAISSWVMGNWNNFDAGKKDKDRERSLVLSK